MKDRRFAKYVGWFIFAVALITIYKTIDSVGIVFEWFQGLFKILAPFGLAVLLAYLLYFPCRKIENLIRKAKWKFISNRARWLSIIIIYIIVILAIVLLFKVILPLLYESVIDLANSLPNYYNRAIELLESQPEDSILTKIDAVSYVKKLEEVNVSEMIIDFVDFNNISKYIKTITSFAGVIFDIFITLVVSFYIITERGDIKNFCKNLFGAICSEKGYNRISRYYGKLNDIFYKFITAQIFDAIIVGIITSIAMLIMNVKYAGLLGFLIGLFNIIPYFGAIIAVGFAVILTIFTGGLGKALWLALVIIILQQIDANIINPKILGDSLNISRILIVFSVTLFGAWFGIIGMFLAVPMIGLIKVFVLDFIEEKNKEKELEAVKETAKKK
ncbi:MAG: AI-2E family transporter [Clostridia bacterium]|nr:AI-2E family transporter [Clostridia bacterium]